MKYKILLLCVVTSFITFLQAQKTPKTAGYAITAPQKGQTSWKEIRLVDVATGDEMKTVYQSAQQIEILNARTGKPVVKKDISKNLSNDASLFKAGNLSFGSPAMNVLTPRTGRPAVKEDVVVTGTPARKVINLDMELAKKDVEEKVVIAKRQVAGNVQTTNTDPYDLDIVLKNGQQEKVYVTVKGNELKRDAIEKRDINTRFDVIAVRGFRTVQSDMPFATNSAACAYDKKHERLYYTPLSINQLRYIDLKSKTPRIYYFEDEPFGTATPGDGNNQITRMVIASDGNGYALTNSGDHLIRFTTGKKPVITDLGSLTDDPANGSSSVHSRSGYGGDMIADASENLYLITANRNVFKISLDSRVATYKGTIKGLPRGFTTNGAMVEEGSKVIVCSAESTLGYFKFDLNTLEAGKASSGQSVFNASDLANGNLAFDKKKKEPQATEEKTVVTETSRQPLLQEVFAKNSISVFPNPVTNGFVKLVFADQPSGKYNVQFMDISGKTIRSKDVYINSSSQVEEFNLSDIIVKGNYLVKVVNENNKISIVNKLVVQ